MKLTQGMGTVKLTQAIYWQQASQALAQVDQVMASLVAQHSEHSLVSRGTPFVTLMRSIVGQQISVKAADSVWAKLMLALPEMTPAQVIVSAIEPLRACGLSARKISYLQDLARHFQEGVLSGQTWHGMGDAEIVSALTAVKGIGVWTAEMFLIFSELRPDVFPLDDIGLQKAVALHYLQGERPSRQRLLELGERWRPWRSVATWYLWRSLDPVAVAY
ncbi:MAG: DNA-3-methyladenine glycosylase 2 family protein [Pseudomonadota bacterium]